MITTIDRKEMLDLFDKCGALARYHIEQAKNAACVLDNDEADRHVKIVDHYIAVRWDLLKLIKEGS